MGKHTLCPFCVSSWDCDGPHIEPKDLDSFFERLDYIREDFAEYASEVIKDYAVEKNQDYSELQELIYSKLIRRSFN